MSADLGFTSILSFFFLLFYLLYSSPTPELAERNLTETGHILESKCDLKMRVRKLSLKIGGPKTTFLTISQLSGNFNGLYLLNEKLCT